MSTFGGFMEEFPDIRVDYFRQIPLLRPPLACFLSHVHSDHLTGLETLKSPFVYCSAATKALLLRLERYPHRMNFAKGILESRKQHYKPLKTLLKTIPLETPTQIELAPGNHIQVTLFDANHCTGAVMFLIEGHGRAVLYTGDIRSEPWFVNNIMRNPLMIEYTTGLKILDCIYLDTSNIEPITFPTKAEGLRELLGKVAAYPTNTIFHFSAWTFGYEEVWVALAKTLNSKIHVDEYKYRMYRALRGEPATESNSLSREGPALAGYQCGNAPQHGCLTQDPSGRIHSCEKGANCPAIDGNIVWIRPIIARTKDGHEIGEIGVGGGGGDLTQSPELEVDSDTVLEYLLSLLETADPNEFPEIKKRLLLGFKSQGKAVSLDEMGLGRNADELSFKDLATAFARSLTGSHKEKPSEETSSTKAHGSSLPKLITFPYSRHSSYEELCHLVSVFKPRDVYPCTVDEKNWHPDHSMKSLFGQHCSGQLFRHDMQMEHMHSELLRNFGLPQDQIHSSIGQDERSSIYSTPSKKSSSQDVIGVSPGSASQGVRRRALVETLEQLRGKRPRLSGETSSSLSDPSDNFRAQLYDREIGQLQRIDQNNISSQHPLLTDVQLHEDTSGSEYAESQAFYDSDDEVMRCKTCEHEFWAPVGPCTNCDSGKTQFMEVLEPQQEVKMQIVEDEYESETDAANPLQQELAENYLDYQSSAYDSQDVASVDEDYEKNSFIDDAPINGDESDGESSADDEPNYKALFEDVSKDMIALQEQHYDLIDMHDSLLDEYTEFRRDLLGSDDEPEFTRDSFASNDDSENDMPDSIKVVDVAPPEPMVTEITLGTGGGLQQDETTNVHGESQSSDKADATIGAHAEIYDLTQASSMTSGGNHTYEELIL
ncbi:artemis protein [Phlyctema vagabunda]|uniref:Protein artemis n=1 Tax=Phlyctema vagabunda TaxID=108571 RepID=A0ABR4PNX8_9HELO